MTPNIDIENAMRSFDVTAMNPDLLYSHQQVFELRHIARQFFLGQRIQSIKLQQNIEKARTITAFVEALLKAGIVRQVLVLSKMSPLLDQIQSSFKLHSECHVQHLVDHATAYAQVNFVSYTHFFELYGYADLDQVFAHFDLIITDDLGQSSQQMFMKKLQHYKNWLLKIETSKTRSVAMN